MFFILLRIIKFIHSFILQFDQSYGMRLNQRACCRPADFIIYVCREFYRPSELNTQHAACLSENQPKDIDAIHFHSVSEI